MRTEDEGSRPAPESPFPLLATRDVELARQYITSAYLLPHELKARDDRALDFKLRYLASPRLTLGHLGFGADTEMRFPSMVECYHVNLTVAGKTRVAQRGRWATTEAGRSGAIFAPDDPFTVRWSPEAVQYAIKLPRSWLEAELSKLVNRPVEQPVRFELGFDLTTPAGSALLAAVRFLRSELARPDGIATMPLARTQLESYVLTQILLTVPHAYTDLLQAPDRPTRRSRIQAVIEMIDEDPTADLSLAELASAAGVTARALQRGFMEVAGTSPTAYVRGVRLDRVHEDLIAEAGRTPITEIAMRWGFFHFGRFAQQYRQRIGVLPSETVRRALRTGA